MMQAVGFQRMECCSPGEVFLLDGPFFLEGDDEVIIEFLKEVISL
jgi:hypothetical protein